MLKNCIHQEFHFLSVPRKESADLREDSVSWASGQPPHGLPREPVRTPAAIRQVDVVGVDSPAGEGSQVLETHHL